MKRTNNTRHIRHTLRDTSGLKFLGLTFLLAYTLWVYGTVTQVEAVEPVSPAVINVVTHAVPAEVEGVGEVTVQSPPTLETFEVDDMSAYISEAVQEFLPTHKSESLMIMHCLAHRENGHAANRNCGDSGESCGPFQFKQETWNRMRKQMIKVGKATEIGDRYDKKESARTTAWAMNNGNAREWGPISRDAKGSNYAACQVPSWYKEK